MANPIQDFLQAINPASAFGSGPEQLGLADILGAIGNVAGPVLAARGGRIGLPLGLGLGTVGELGATLADRRQRSAQGQQTYAALRGMLPMIKGAVPGAEQMLEGVRTGAITPDEFLKHVETYTKPRTAGQAKWLVNKKTGALMGTATPEMESDPSKIPADATLEDLYKADQVKSEQQQERETFQTNLDKQRAQERADLATTLAADRASLAMALKKMGGGAAREGSFDPIYDTSDPSAPPKIIGAWDRHAGKATMLATPIAGSKTPPRAAGGKLTDKESRIKDYLDAHPGTPRETARLAIEKEDAEARRAPPKKAVSDEDVDDYRKTHPITAGHATTREEAKEALAKGISKARAEGSASGRGPKDKGKADYFLPDGTPVYSKDLKGFGGKLPKGAIKASDFGKAPSTKGGKPQFTNVAGEKIGINPISGLPFAAGAATGTPGGIAGFLGGGSKPPKPPAVVKMVLKMAAGLTGNQVVQEKNPEGKPGYSIIGKDGVKYWLTPDANFEP